MEAFIEWGGIFPLTLVGVPILALTAIVCLLYCRGKNRRYLAWAAGIFLGTLALFFCGNILLGFFGMTWRNLPSMVLSGVLLVSGWVGIILTLNCLMPAEWPEIAPVLRWAVKGAVLFFAAVVLLVTLWLGPLVLAFAYGNPERIVEYQGQTLLEVDDGFLDPHWSYYVCHGPLFRETERLYDEYEPLVHN